MHRVDLGESFQTQIYLQNLASIQPRASSLKFAASRDGCVQHYRSQLSFLPEDRATVGLRHVPAGRFAQRFGKSCAASCPAGCSAGWPVGWPAGRLPVRPDGRLAGMAEMALLLL